MIIADVVHWVVCVVLAVLNNAFQNWKRHTVDSHLGKRMHTVNNAIVAGCARVHEWWEERCVCVCA